MNHPGKKSVNEYNVGTPAFLSYLSKINGNAHWIQTFKYKSGHWIGTLVMWPIKE
jgi:hypothetical protein